MKRFKTIWNFKDKKQITRLLDRVLKVKEKSFIKDLNQPFIGLYNETIQSKNQDKDPFLTKWIAAVNQFLKGEPIDRIEPEKIEFRIERIGENPESVIRGRVRNLLYLWLWHVIKGDLILRVCEAEDCPRIFTPTSRLDQTFCSNRCRMRIVMRRIKKRKELRTRKAEG